MEIQESELPHQMRSACYFMLTGLEGLALLAWLSVTRNDYGSIGAWKASSGTQIFSTLWFAIAFGFTSLGILVLFQQKTARNFVTFAYQFLLGKKKGIRWVLPLIFMIYLILTTDRIVRLDLDPLLQYFFVEPFSIWFYLITLQSLICLLWNQKLFSDLLHKKTFLISVSIIAFLWLFISSTRIGLTPDSHYWNVAGVPMLINQLILILFIVILAGYFLDWVSGRNNGNRPGVWLDIVICLVIAVGAAWLWKQAPFSNSFFAKGPYPPNQDLYPYSDAALTDLGGQYMLIGERLEYPYFTEKPLYTEFLGLLHRFASQSYIKTTDFQILCFAILPVLLYILGKLMASRIFGLALALFATVKEYNAISATYYISVSNSRLYLSEFPMLIFMVFLAITLWMWFKRPQKQKFFVILSGAVLGFALMVRTNALVLIPFVIVAALFDYKFRWKQILPALGVFFLGFILAIAPWVAYNQVEYGTDPFSYKIQSVIQTRFLHKLQSPAPTGLPEKDTLLFSLWSPHMEQVTLKVSPSIRTSEETQLILDYPKIITSHFFNNEIKALFVLPFQIYPLELTPVLSLPYWEEPVTWEGEMPLSTGLAFATNLILISVGISSAWKKNQIAGLIPLMINIGYYLSNALGRTSGSRYLLPADWTLYFYFLLGLAAIWQRIKQKTIVRELSELAPTENDNISLQSERKRLIISGIIILFLGSLVPIINLSYPKLYENQTQETVLAELQQSSIFAHDPELSEQVNALLNQEDGMIFIGRMLYPRYRDFEPVGENGLFLTVLRPELTEVFFHFDNDDLTTLEEGKDVIIIGCQKKGYVEGFLGYLPAQDLILRSNIPFSEDFCQH